MECEGFLIAPVQHVCRVRLLLRSIARRTAADHPDKQAMATALEQFTAAAARIEADMEGSVQEQRCRAFRQRFANCPLAAAGDDSLWEARKHLMHGVLSYVTRYGSVDRCEVFLFSDQLVYVRKPLAALRPLRSVGLGSPSRRAAPQQAAHDIAPLAAVTAAAGTATRATRSCIVPSTSEPPRLACAPRRHGRR